MFACRMFACRRVVLGFGHLLYEMAIGAMLPDGRLPASVPVAGSVLAVLRKAFDSPQIELCDLIEMPLFSVLAPPSGKGLFSDIADGLGAISAPIKGLAIGALGEGLAKSFGNASSFGGGGRRDEAASPNSRMRTFEREHR